MKSILFILLLVSSVAAFGQKMRSVEIWTKPMTKEKVKINYLEDRATGKVDTIILFMGQNHAYMHIVDLITIFQGSPKEFYRFLNDLEVFYNENEAGTSDEIAGHVVFIDRPAGGGAKAKVLGVHEPAGKGKGYHGFRAKDMGKFREKFTEWCQKNNVAYE